MTTATPAPIASRQTKRAEPRSSALSIAQACRRAAAFVAAMRWPSERYQKDPVAFAREVLGIEPWSRQIEILEAVRDHKRVTIRSGHKCGKSTSAAILALWFYCSFPRARVVMTSVTSRQVDAILWLEVRRLLRGALIEIAGDVHELARSGLKAEDLREITGYTAKEAEAIAGVSSPYLLYIVDEASGVPEVIFRAINGNTAGGAWRVYISNPTRTEGAFYRSHNEEKAHWKCIHISSLDTPNVIEDREVIPGLAMREWCDMLRAVEGEKGTEYRIRACGEFPVMEEGRTLSYAAIEDAQNRWETAHSVGRLSVGLDPAGGGEDGDEIAMTAVRGAKQLAALEERGRTPDQICADVVDFIDVHRSGTEIPRLVVDIEGETGWETYRALRDYLEEHPGAFELVGVRAGKRARKHEFYKTIRDELWASLVRWVQRAGILLDEKLRQDLHAPFWVKVTIGEGTNRPRKVRMLTPKKELRVKLGRSPDRGDALALAVWDAGGTDEDLAVDVASQVKPMRTAEPDEDLTEGGAMDPYAGANAWGGS